MASTMQKTEKATFAGGCFWCMEPPYADLPGVLSVMPGYAGGEEIEPAYEDVASGRTGHREAVQIEFDPAIISFNRLVEVYWQQIDPTDAGGSFVDRGFHYSSAIFYHDDAQRQVAEASRQNLVEQQLFADPIATVIEPFTTFYPAENYHRQFYKTNRMHYKSYRMGSGRDAFIEQHWSDSVFQNSQSKPSEDELKAKLTKLQFDVTQRDATEKPFNNEYWDNKAEGLYVDIVSGEPLFSSQTKFDSGTGWPSFYQPIETDNIIEKEDRKLFSKRTEVRSRQGDSHLGHVFPDGPAPTGLRYCINSAALRFIPVEKLAEEGYEAFLPLFEK